MSVLLPPAYDQVSGAVQTNGNRHYKIFHGTDSAGNPGTWHVYYDGKDQFIVDTPSVMGGGQPNSMQISAAAALASAPTAPVQPNGGVAVPDSSATPPQDVSPSGLTGSKPQKPDSNHDWKFNDDNNQWYYEESHDASDGSSGKFHVYADGTRVYVAKTPADAMSGNTPNSMQDSAAAALASSPAPTVSPNDSMHPNPATVAPSWNAPTQPVADNPTGGTLAPDSISSTAVSSSNTYTVAEGDTMWGIAQKNHMSLDELRALNPKVQDMGLIHPGEQINLGGGVAPAADTLTFPSSSSYGNTVVAESRAMEAPQKVSGLGGWSDGTSSVPNDPTHGIASAAPPVHQTDPLKINDNKDNA